MKNIKPESIILRTAHRIVILLFIPILAYAQTNAAPAINREIQSSPQNEHMHEYTEVSSDVKTMPADNQLSSNSSSIYDIAEIYEQVELKDNTKVLDKYDNIIDAKKIFVPTKYNTGRYDVELTKIDTDFYHVVGTSIYIETKYCYEYAYRDEAILNITSNYGYTRGEVIFLD